MIDLNTSNTPLNILWSAVASITTAVVAILIDKLKAGRAFITAAQILEDNTKRLQFIEYWIKVTLQIASIPNGDAKSAVQDQCDRILQDATDQLSRIRSSQSDEKETFALVWFRRIVDSILHALLISGSRRPFFWAPRLIFYFSVTMLILILRIPGTSLLDPRIFLFFSVGAICWILVRRFDDPSPRDT